MNKYANINSLYWMKGLTNSPTQKAMISLLAILVISNCTGKSLDSEFVLESEREISSYTSYSLPKGMVTFNVQSNEEADRETIYTITKPTVEFVADPQARFRFSFNYSAWADDTFDIQIDKRGLLSSANVVNEDKTPEIVQNALSVAGELAGLASSDRTVGRNRSMDVVFDPYDPRQVDYSARRVHAMGLFMTVKTVEGDYLYKDNRIVAAYHEKFKYEARALASQCNSSLCFRTVQPIIVEVFDESQNFFSRTVLDVPNSQNISSFDITRTACVKRTNDLKFSEGVLAQIKVEKPSEILGCLSIPASIVKAILGFPS